MITAKHYDTVISPIYTEKATNQVEGGKYSFKVSSVASKQDIKKAVEKIFGVKVLSVNVLNGKPKIKVFKGVQGKRSAFKKAIITLEKGKTIDLSKGA